MRLSPNLPRSRRHVRGAAVLGLIALLAAASFAIPRPSSAQASDLVGEYTVSIQRDALPTDVPNAPSLTGRWRIAFGADGSYQAERLDLGVLVDGSYETNGDTVTITDASGLLSCTNATMASAGNEDVSAGTYTYALADGQLTLTVKDDGCALRRLLLGTLPLGSYVACTPGPVGLDIATPGATPQATPVASGGGLFGLLTPTAPASPGATDSATTDAAIDGLLAQMSSCWATGDPQRFLPLLSASFRQQFSIGSEAEQASAVDALNNAMSVPITWERAGETRTESDGRVSAVVRTTSGTDEQFVRYYFVFEDGAWKWDGSES